MSKKRIIITAAAGLISFAGTFTFSWLSKGAAADLGDESNQVTSVSQVVEPQLPAPPGGVSGAVSDGTVKKGMTERQLKTLVYGVREKVQDYNSKLQRLESREQRLEMAHNTIKKDIERLNELRVELASIVASVKEQQDKLEKSRVKITEAERVNLVSIATTYDKMDAASAGKILTNMSRMKYGNEGDGLDDAVKILHYMADRTKAKLLAQLTVSEPDLAAVFCQQLKQIVESEPILP